MAGHQVTVVVRLKAKPGKEAKLNPRRRSLPRPCERDLYSVTGMSGRGNERQ